MSNAKMTTLINVLAKEYKFDAEEAIDKLEAEHADLFSKKFFDKKLVEKPPIADFTNKVAEDKYNEYKEQYKLPKISKMTRTGGKNNKQISKDDVQKAIEAYSAFDIRIILSEKGIVTCQELNISFAALKKEYRKGTFKKTATGFINVTSIKTWWKNRKSTPTVTPTITDDSEADDSEIDSDSD